MTGADAHRGKGLIVDPIHRYLVYTRSHGIAGEATEEDLIDTPWVQRLRRIPQLQSARWVFPTAEHSRFPHALGAMHVAGRFAQQLWPSLRAVIADARVCRVGVEPDLGRIFYYSFITSEGLTLDRRGTQALIMFLTAR